MVFAVSVILVSRLALHFKSLLVPQTDESTSHHAVDGRTWCVLGATRLIRDSLLVIATLGFHILVVSLVNALYVIYRTSLSSGQLAIVQLLYAVVDVLYERVFVAASMQLIMRSLAFSASRVSAIYSLLLIILNVVIPILSTMILDELCFGYPGSTVTTTYESSECVAYTAVTVTNNIIYFACAAAENQVIYFLFSFLSRSLILSLTSLSLSATHNFLRSLFFKYSLMSLLHTHTLTQSRKLITTAHF